VWADQRFPLVDVPDRLLRDTETGVPLAPLFPPLGVDWEATLSLLERRLAALVRLSGEGPTSGIGAVGAGR
jgi:hypothetical protein